MVQLENHLEQTQQAQPVEWETQMVGLSRIVYRQLRNSLLRHNWDLHQTRSRDQEIFSSFRILREFQQTGACASDKDDFLRYVSQRYMLSYSQLFQDLFVLWNLGEGPGYFVEFGATDGHLLSNTFLLERDFGWTGILVEPARYWHSKLAENRSAHIDHSCVSAVSGREVKFSESTDEPMYSSVDTERGQRSFNSSTNTIEYNVDTISLSDLLDKYEAPKIIDYLSIDTEGTEWEILSNFDFLSRNVRVLTVEHNGEPNRSKIAELLYGHGFRHLFSDLSAWDDWYVRDGRIN